MEDNATIIAAFAIVGVCLAMSFAARIIDQRDQLYRKMFKSMFMLVRNKEKQNGGNETNTTMFQPAQQ